MEIWIQGGSDAKEDRRVKVEEQCPRNNTHPISFFLLCVPGMKGTGYWNDLWWRKWAVTC